MARVQRKWSELEAEIFRRLRETKGSSYWSDGTNDQILDFANQAKDMREMEMHNAYEGYGLVSYTADLVQDQALYAMPSGGSRVWRIFRVFSDGSEKPLVRYERITHGLDASFVHTGDQYFPTYRMVGNQIKLEPSPGEAIAAGLRIEVEEASARFSGPDSLLPADWPILSETLIVLDTVLLALSHEDSEDPGAIDVTRSLREREGYASRWNQYIETRTRGLVTGERFSLGA